MELVKVQDGHITVAEEVMKELDDFQVKKPKMHYTRKGNQTSHAKGYGRQ